MPRISDKSNGNIYQETEDVKFRCWQSTEVLGKTKNDVVGKESLIVYYKLSVTLVVLPFLLLKLGFVQGFETRVSTNVTCGRTRTGHVTWPSSGHSCPPCTSNSTLTYVVDSISTMGLAECAWTDLYLHISWVSDGDGYNYFSHGPILFYSVLARVCFVLFSLFYLSFVYKRTGNICHRLLSIWD